MNIVIGSAHRNNAPRLKTYLAQALALADELRGHDVRLIAAEGDSRDGTRALLAAAKNVEVVDATHGGPHYPSVETAERFAALSAVGNKIFEAVRPDDDFLIYVESDLLWAPETMVHLIRLAAQRAGGCDVFAPLIMAGDLFYDIWAYRLKDGRRFQPLAPYAPGLNGKLYEVGSVGSCLVMRGEVARTCRIRDGNALVGWCADARAQGYRIAVDPTAIVRHPA